MKKNTFLFLALVCSFLSFGQCPTTDIILTTQTEIDNFSINYPNCYALTHDLKIEEENNTIDNLTGLSLITSAKQIFIFGTQINDFSGLENLEDIVHFAAWFNHNIQNLDGLSSLQNIEMLELFINGGLTDLSGLDDIQNINNINILGNPNLNDITDLSFIEVLNTLVIGGNNLTTLSGLENIYKITEDLNINHENVSNLNELEGLETIGGSLYITFNPLLQDISALENIETLNDLFIVENIKLESLVGLDNLHTVNETLRVGFNHTLEEMYGLNSIYSVKKLEIYENDNLITLKGLESLHKITQRLLINDNPDLVNLEHLVHVSSDEVDEVIMINNDNLAICDFQLFCNVISDDSVVKVINNNAPGCNSIEEIGISCLDDFNDTNGGLNSERFKNKLIIYPNPVSESVNILAPDYLNYNKTIVYTFYGDKLFETSNKKINFSSLSNGIYFVEITTNQGSVIKKIIKE